jgi:hypothetical protein
MAYLSWDYSLLSYARPKPHRRSMVPWIVSLIEVVESDPAQQGNTERGAYTEQVEVLGAGCPM